MYNNNKISDFFKFPAFKGETPLNFKVLRSVIGIQNEYGKFNPFTLRLDAEYNINNIINLNIYKYVNNEVVKEQ